MDNLPDVISICVCEEVRTLEVCGACLLSLIGSIEYGYVYAEPEEFEGNMSRAYDILFGETLKRLESKGVHLRL
jgi:hypothetical protein